LVDDPMTRTRVAIECLMWFGVTLAIGSVLTIWCDGLAVGALIAGGAWIASGLIDHVEKRMKSTLPQRMRDAARTIAELNALQGYNADTEPLSPRCLREEARRMEEETP
jgi:hypothetical protein